MRLPLKKKLSSFADLPAHIVLFRGHLARLTTAGQAPLDLDTYRLFLASLFSFPVSVFHQYTLLFTVTNGAIGQQTFEAYANVFCSSVQYAEYGGLLAAAKIALEERRILSYPQLPTTIPCDNEFAVGLAHCTLTPKLSKSKSIDMRFHWLQERVRERQFCVQHVPGVLNLADYFTKSLPVYKHNQFAPYIASDSTNAPTPDLLPTTVST